MAQRGPRRTVRPRTLDQFIENARGGDPARIWDLYYFTEDPQFRTIGVLRLALSHLSIENVPAHGDGGIAGGEEVAARAVASIFLLLSSVVLFMTDPPLREAATKPIIESIDSICVWAQLCVHFNLAPPGAGPMETYNRIGRLFVQLLLHPVFQDALLVTPAFHNLVIQMWVTRNITMDLDHDEQYHVLLLFGHFVESPGEDVMLLFTQRIMSRPLRWTSEFAAMTIERMHRLRNLIVGGQGAIGTVIKYTWILLKSVESIVSACEHLRRAFIKVDYLKQIALDLNTMSAALVERNATQFLTSMFPATWEIAVHIFNTKTPFRSVKNARDVISGNFLAHTIRLLASSHLTPDETSQGKEIIKLLGRYASCPDVIVELGKLPEIDRFSLRGLAGNEQAWFFWNGFRLSIMQRNTYFIKTQYNGDFICDYASCDSTNHGTAGSSDTGKLKKCSRCSSVVYCSTECQRKDWIEFHRGECTESRNEHIRRKSSQSCYTHQMRRFHVAYVAFLLNRYCSGLEWDIADRRSITSLDGSCLILQPDSVSLEGEGWWESHPQLHFPQHYLKPRLSALKDEYISGAGSPGVRLVQAFFPLGMKFGVVLTVRLTKSGDQYKGGYSMVRYGLPA